MPDIHNFASASLAPDIELVVFGWSTLHGHCDDCGIPAAYTVERDPATRYCSVCAAGHASDGETIIRLFEDD